MHSTQPSVNAAVNLQGERVENGAMPAAVYRHINAAGETIYIGCSINPMARFSMHRGKSPWATQVVNIAIDWFPSQDAALAEERRLIAAEKPIYNRTCTQRAREKLEPQTLGPVLKRWIEDHGITVTAFARSAGLSESYIWRVIRCEVSPIYKTAQAIHKATGGAFPSLSWRNRAAPIERVSA
jgi:hypothetical protein